MGLDMYLSARRNLPESFRISGVARAEFNRDGNIYTSPNFYSELYAEALAASGLASLGESEYPHGTIVSDGDNERDGFAFVHTIGYWRKANHIHAWFVSNVQKRVDDCGLYPVSREQLQALRTACTTVLGASQLVPGQVRTGQRLTEEGEWEDMLEPGSTIRDPSVAQEVLPTQPGFFFGALDYDEWYLRAVENTVEIIDRALAAPDDVGFTYQSSW